MRINFPVHDHRFADAARLAKRFWRSRIRAGFASIFSSSSSNNWVMSSRSVRNRIAGVINDGNVLAVPHALRDHQAVDAVGRQIFHVAVEQAGSFAVQHAVAIADHGANRGAGSGQRALAHVAWGTAADRDNARHADGAHAIGWGRETGRARSGSDRDVRSRLRPSGSRLRSSCLSASTARARALSSASSRLG